MYRMWNKYVYVWACLSLVLILDLLVSFLITFTQNFNNLHDYKVLCILYTEESPVFMLLDSYTSMVKACLCSPKLQHNSTGKPNVVVVVVVAVVENMHEFVSFWANL